MILIINWYIDPDPVRQAELEECLLRNIDNPYIERIVALDEEGTEIIDHPKVIPHPFDGRPSYSDFFKVGNGYDGVKVLANSDIFFDDTIELANRIKERQFFVLCRYEVDVSGNVKFSDNIGMHDVWIWRGINNIQTSMGLGRWGCDHHIAGLMVRAGWAVFSPSKSIRSFHLHNSGVRRYVQERILRPVAHVTPDTIESVECMKDGVCFYIPV